MLQACSFRGLMDHLRFVNSDRRLPRRIRPPAPRDPRSSAPPTRGSFDLLLMLSFATAMKKFQLPSCRSQCQQLLMEKDERATISAKATNLGSGTLTVDGDV